jgi:hypothetical protein
MRLSMTMARGYAATHGSRFESDGIVVLEGDAGQVWEQSEADALAALALDDVGQQVA